MIGVAAAAFGDDLFDLSSAGIACLRAESEAEQLACEWHNINQRLGAMAGEDGLDPEWLSKVFKAYTTILSLLDFLADLTSGFDKRKTS